MRTAASNDMQDITATLVDLAVRGYLLIQVREEKKLLGLRTSREYRFSLRRPVSAWSELQAHEQSLMGSLFAGEARDALESSELEHTFYAYLPGIRDRIFDRLVERGFYLGRPDTVKHRYVIAGVLVGILVGVGGALLCIHLGQSPLPSIVSGVLSAGIAIGFGGWHRHAPEIVLSLFQLRRPPHTRSGCLSPVSVQACSLPP